MAILIFSKLVLLMSKMADLSKEINQPRYKHNIRRELNVLLVVKPCGKVEARTIAFLGDERTHGK